MGCYFCIISERMSRQCQNTHNSQSDALVQAVLILLHTSKVYLVVWTPFKPLACQVVWRESLLLRDLFPTGQAAITAGPVLIGFQKNQIMLSLIPEGKINRMPIPAYSSQVHNVALATHRASAFRLSH